MLVYKVDSNYNLSDILTKSLPARQRKALRERIMYCEGDPNPVEMQTD